MERSFRSQSGGSASAVAASGVWPPWTGLSPAKRQPLQRPPRATERAPHEHSARAAARPWIGLGASADYRGSDSCPPGADVERHENEAAEQVRVGGFKGIGSLPFCRSAVAEPIPARR